MINRVILEGRLTKDPVLQYTASNIAYLKFSLAVNRKFADPQGNKKTDFPSCIVWRKQAENIHRYVGKGSMVAVEGKICHVLPPLMDL